MTLRLRLAVGALLILHRGLTALGCPSTCFGSTCEDWDDKSCAELESYGCDCSGCSCGSGGAANDDKDDGTGVWTPSPTAALAGTWSAETLLYAGVNRTYRVYLPAGADDDDGGAAGAGATGMLIFLHGVGMSDAVRHDYGVAATADEYGFVGVVPNGLPYVHRRPFLSSSSSDIPVLSNCGVTGSSPG